jgi:hypothetical protein
MSSFFDINYIYLKNLKMINIVKSPDYIVKSPDYIFKKIEMLFEFLFECI